MYAVTGATGQLGRLVIQSLLKTAAPDQVLAAVRDPAKAADLAGQGVQVREADYDRPETLLSAFRGVDRLLLISSSEVGGRTPQHRAVIDAAKTSGVKLIAYTSILHADRSPLRLAIEHKETEAALVASGLPVVLLRNGWYTENYLLALKPALEHGAMLGSAKEGRVSLAARADYAEAAAQVLIAESGASQTYELAGDQALTLSELSAEISRQAGREVSYNDLPESEYMAALVGNGLPRGYADLIADADAQAAEGALFDDGRDLSRLIGRPTTPGGATIADALAAD